MIAIKSIKSDCIIVLKNIPNCVIAVKICIIALKNCVIAVIPKIGIVIFVYLDCHITNLNLHYTSIQIRLTIT